MKRKFDVTVTVDLTLELDGKVFEQVDDSWREQFYDLYTTKDIAEHIAYNMVCNDCLLTQIEGFANLSDKHAQIVSSNTTTEAEEIKRPAKRRSK